MFNIVPTGFIPTQDQGYLIVNVQMPDASSIDRTDGVVTQLANLAFEDQRDSGCVRGFRVLDPDSRPTHPRPGCCSCT